MLLDAFNEGLPRFLMAALAHHLARRRIVRGSQQIQPIRCLQNQTT